MSLDSAFPEDYLDLIRKIHAREVLDSRGNPTVEVEAFLGRGSGRAIVPSGASTGKAEALELRDGDLCRYGGQGVLNAVENVTHEIAPTVTGFNAFDQYKLDRHLIDLDGSENKSRLGANAILGVSLAVARAAADSARVPFYCYVGGKTACEIPVPMANILSGGLHGGNNIDFQDFLVIPLRACRYAEALADIVAIYRAMKATLQSRGLYTVGVADEGGYAPKLPSNEIGFELMVEAFERAGFRPGKDAAIALDVASSRWWSGTHYFLKTEGVEMSSHELNEKFRMWSSRYPILSIEDALAEEDWQGWQALTAQISNRCQLIGDDLFVTNTKRLRKGIEFGVANAILIKMNQIGTLTETLEVIRIAKNHGYHTVVSARSGETEDDSIADLAVGTSASQIKLGAITRSERLAKYNRLLRIEEELGKSAIYRGSDVFAKWKSI